MHCLVRNMYKRNLLSLPRLERFIFIFCVLNSHMHCDSINLSMSDLPLGRDLFVGFSTLSFLEVTEVAHIIYTAFNAIAPILLLIGLGYFLKQKGFLSKDFLRVGNNLVFRFCLPAMLFINVYDIDDLQHMNWNVVLYCVVITILIFLLGLMCAVMITKVPNRRGVLLQCAFRSNFAIIGLTLAAALGGAQAVANASIISAVTIPLYNVLAVISLTIFMHKSDSAASQIKSVVSNIAKNPLILGVLTGVLCVLIRHIQKLMFGEVIFSLKVQFKFLYTALNHLKSLTTPLALIVLGGQFEFSAVKELRVEILAGTLMRTVIAPVLGIGAAIVLSNHTGFFSCGADMYPALIALFGSPVAVSSAVMAGAMGNDEQLAGQLVVWTSIASIATIFLQVCLLMYFGLLVV